MHTYFISGGIEERREWGKSKRKSKSKSILHTYVISGGGIEERRERGKSKSKSILHTYFISGGIEERRERGKGRKWARHELSSGEKGPHVWSSFCKVAFFFKSIIFCAVKLFLCKMSILLLQQMGLLDACMMLLLLDS